MLRSLGTELLDKFDDAIEVHCADGDCGWTEATPVHSERCLTRLERGRDTGFDEPIRCVICSATLEPDDNAMSIPDPENGRYNIIVCVDCGDKISGESKETIDTQEGEQMAMERMERVVAALDELRSAWSDLIDSAGNEDDDKSMATLLAAFKGDEDNKGEED